MDGRTLAFPSRRGARTRTYAQARTLDPRSDVRDPRLGACVPQPTATPINQKIRSHAFAASLKLPSHAMHAALAQTSHASTHERLNIYSHHHIRSKRTSRDLPHKCARRAHKKQIPFFQLSATASPE
eukprot:6176838-Pleurochrysis_carterae.AAC.2